MVPAAPENRRTPRSPPPYGEAMSSNSNED
jgi:hypothetical protein